jgi:hypothetical protein
MNRAILGFWSWQYKSAVAICHDQTFVVAEKASEPKNSN